MSVWDAAKQDLKQGPRQDEGKYAKLFYRPFGTKFYKLGSDDSDAALTKMRDAHLDYLSHQK